MVESGKASLLRFNFELDAIDDILPWGEGDERKLHWFGLTSGRYWISTPLGEALRYTDEQIREWGDQSPYVDYQIARIFEDLQSVVPSALEPVPAEIAALVDDGGWVDAVEKQLKALEETDKLKELYEMFWDATDWYTQRSIDTMYLIEGPIFHFWRWGMKFTSGGRPSAKTRRVDGACRKDCSRSPQNSLNLLHTPSLATCSPKLENELRELQPRAGTAQIANST